MPDFKFELVQDVEIIVSGERGLVIARAEFIDHGHQYQVRYKAADGLAVEAWRDEAALTFQTMRPANS